MGKNNANVFDVAEYILGQCGDMTTMKLQKLVYYSQAWSLAWDEVPLFEEDFQAWAAGPVCVELYQAHKGRFVVGSGFFKELMSGYKFTEDEIESMGVVLKSYCEKPPQQLSDMTHSETPWIEARHGVPPGERSTNIISKETMQQYYAGLMTDE